MLNYRIQSRVLHHVRGSELQLPALARVSVLLTPAASLGSAVGGRTHVLGGESRITWNANTDRHGVESIPPLPPIRMSFESSVGTWEVEGETLHFATRFEDQAHLSEWLGRLLFLLPGLLNLELLDPTAVVGLTLESGTGLYRLQYQTGSQRVAPGTSSELQQDLIAASLRRLESSPLVKPKRLQAALHYFHVAARLLTIADSPWEFMPEAALNMNKVLEVLFSTDRICDQSNQQARVELECLGVSEQSRETLISVMKLRSHMDVAHVDTWEYTPGSLDGAYELLRVAEPTMRDMLKLLVQRLESGDYELKQDWGSSPEPEVERLLARLREMYCLPRADAGSRSR